jgi:hypothetical protein
MGKGGGQARRRFWRRSGPVEHRRRRRKGKGREADKRGRRVSGRKEKEKEDGGGWATRIFYHMAYLPTSTSGADESTYGDEGRHAGALSWVINVRRLQTLRVSVVAFTLRPPQSPPTRSRRVTPRCRGTRSSNMNESM